MGTGTRLPRLVRGGETHPKQAWVREADARREQPAVLQLEERRVTPPIKGHIEQRPAFPSFLVRKLRG